MLPPFPSQDLAKLVLGYLAEEQLMVAYDEFLHASPYLDALQNEYDRIFMTSLRSIMAEYRALKIYVETCKPLLLRKKIFQCSNLLDIVKFLVNHVDINQIQLEEAAEKASFGKQTNVTLKTNSCEVCTSLKLINCTCKTRNNQPVSDNQSSQVQAISQQSSVETTPLADLPGNHVMTRKKQIKVLDKDSSFFNDDGQSSDDCLKESLSSQYSVEDKKRSHSVLLKNDQLIVSLNSTLEETDESQKIEEFDTVLKSIVSKNSSVSGSENNPNQRIPNTSTFHDIASGVTGGDGQNANIPDSSTSESLTIQAPLTKDFCNDSNKGHQKCQLLLQVSHKNENNESTRTNDSKFIQINPNTEDPSQKIKIISDVKVTNKFNKGKETKKKMAMKNATSTPVPLMQMQTIVINGTTAFKHPVNSHTYTKDEIMAMPTLIVVPASGASKIPPSVSCQTVMPQNCNVVSNASSTFRPLGPLVIDVPPIPAIVKQPELALNPSDSSVKDLAEADLVKTLDMKNASVPKGTVTGPTTNTPHVLPPVRKSSSTPRRTTHVRVLDFATPLPRRILHETNEQVTSQTSDAPVDTILSSSPNLAQLANADNLNVTSNTPVVIQKCDGCDTDNGSAKENNTDKNTNESKKYNWDADLRALVANDHGPGPSKRKNMKKNTKKKKADDKSTDGSAEEKTSGGNIKSQKTKPKRRRKVVVEDDDEDDDEPLPVTSTKLDVPVKPTINIICGSDRITPHLTPEVQDTKKDEVIEHKLMDNKEDDCVETPEGDRLSLQNMIGAKLNISDLLETPYKQALYDIQMGTPRFLAPDLPGDPLSDIKIMSIPTPRFLDTSKPVQTTPSYATRPTDYSSGGSYYKPDDQDTMPIPDLRCVVSPSSKEDVTDKFADTVSDDDKKSRPQRQCTKNVSYYRFGNNKKEAEVDAASSCSDCTIDNKQKEPVAKTPRERSRSTKSVAKKSKKRKSPVVKEKFIKIKPRQTPTKLTPSRNRKKNESPRYNSPHPTKRNRTTSKDKNENSTPLVVPAPTKSRRKSSTPRKLHCSKSFNTDNSPETIINTKKNAIPQTQDSESEQIALRWSDDGSQETKDKLVRTSATDCEDISKIQAYIQTSGYKKPESEDISKIREYIQNTGLIRPESEGSLQADLIKRGFDSETAKIIERDLLDIPPQSSEFITNKIAPLSIQVLQKKDASPHERTRETDTSVTNDLQIVQDESDDEEFELSVHECNEHSDNYIVLRHDYAKDTSRAPPIGLKDTYSMEVCVDDGLTVRLRATPFSVTLDQDPIGVEEIDHSYKETELAVNSISNMERLYTPLKDSLKAQCYEIFDSTLTSLDTPLKTMSPKRKQCETVTETLSDDEQVPHKSGSNKRKKSIDAQESDSKKTKYLLSSARIQNIDIESVLTKLHGP